MVITAQGLPAGGAATSQGFGDLGKLSQKEIGFMKQAKKNGYNLEQTVDFIRAKRQETPALPKGPTGLEKKQAFDKAMFGGGKERKEQADAFVSKNISEPIAGLQERYLGSTAHERTSMKDVSPYQSPEGKDIMDPVAGALGFGSNLAKGASAIPGRLGGIGVGLATDPFTAQYGKQKTEGKPEVNVLGFTVGGEIGEGLYIANELGNQGLNFLADMAVGISRSTKGDDEFLKDTITKGFEQVYQYPLETIGIAKGAQGLIRGTMKAGDMSATLAVNKPRTINKGPLKGQMITPRNWLKGKVQYEIRRLTEGELARVQPKTPKTTPPAPKGTLAIGAAPKAKAPTVTPPPPTGRAGGVVETRPGSVGPLVPEATPYLNHVAKNLVSSVRKNPAMREKYISKVGQAPEITLLEDGIVGSLESQKKQVLAKGKQSMEFARSEAKRIPDKIHSRAGSRITNKIIEDVDMDIPYMDKVVEPIVAMAKRFDEGTATAEDLILAKTYLSRYEALYDDFGRVKKTGDPFEKEAVNRNYQEMKRDLELLGEKHGIDFKKINHDTMKYEGLRDIMTRAISRQEGRDIMSLSDYVMGGVGIGVDPVAGLSILAVKKTLSSPNVSSRLAKSLYTKQGDVSSPSVPRTPTGSVPSESTGPTKGRAKRELSSRAENEAKIKEQARIDKIMKQVEQAKVEMIEKQKTIKENFDKLDKTGEYTDVPIRGMGVRILKGDITELRGVVTEDSYFDGRYLKVRTDLDPEGIVVGEKELGRVIRRAEQQPGEAVNPVEPIVEPTEPKAPKPTDLSEPERLAGVEKTTPKPKAQQSLEDMVRTGKKRAQYIDGALDELGINSIEELNAPQIQELGSLVRARNFDDKRFARREKLKADVTRDLSQPEQSLSNVDGVGLEKVSTETIGTPEGTFDDLNKPKTTPLKPNKEVAAQKEKLPVEKTPLERTRKEKPKLSIAGGVEGVKPNNQLKYNQGAGYEAVRLVVNDKDALVSRYGALEGKQMRNITGKGEKLTDAQKIEMEDILKKLGIDRKEALARSQQLKDIAKKVRSTNKQVSHEVNDGYRDSKKEPKTKEITKEQTGKYKIKKVKQLNFEPQLNAEDGFIAILDLNGEPTGWYRNKDVQHIITSESGVEVMFDMSKFKNEISLATFQEGFALDNKNMPKLTQKEQVKEVLKEEGVATIKEVAEATGILEPNIRRILGQGEKVGEFTRVAKGVYTIEGKGGTKALLKVGDAMEGVKQLVADGVKMDMVFMDIPYNTPAVRGGNRGVKYELISPEYFDEFMGQIKELVKDNNTPLYHMFSNAKSGRKAMQKYNKIIEKHGFKQIAVGGWQKMFKNGKPVTNVRGKIAEPEGIALYTLDGVFDDKAVRKLDFVFVRPKGKSEKPVQMMTELIEQGSKPGDLLLDPFAGAGPFVEAALKSDRNVVAIEKSPEQAQKIVDRTKGLAKDDSMTTMTVNSETIIKKPQDYATAEEFVKAHGELMYHATKEKFDEFDLSRAGKNTETKDAEFGIFFADSAEGAKAFGEVGIDGDFDVMRASVELNNPLDITTQGVFNNEKQAPFLVELFGGEKMSGKEALQYLNDNIGLGEISDFYEAIYMDINNKKLMQDAGFDGIVSELGGGFKEYAVFETNQIKTESQLRKIREEANQGASKVSADLIEEAKKFKSADEFVKGKQKLYQGRSKKGLEILIKDGEGRFTTDRGVGVQFADAYKHAEIYDSKNHNIFQTISNKELKGEVYERYLDYNNPKQVSLSDTRRDRKVERKFIEEAKQEGKDALEILLEDGSLRDVVIFDKSQIKTESQLRKIREEANKTKEIPLEKSTEAKKGLTNKKSDTTELSEADKVQMEAYIDKIGGLGFIGTDSNLSHEVKFLNDRLADAKDWMDKYGELKESDVYAVDGVQRGLVTKEQAMEKAKEIRAEKQAKIDKGEYTEEMLLEEYKNDPDAIKARKERETTQKKIDNIKTIDDLTDIGFEKMWEKDNGSKQYKGYIDGIGRRVKVTTRSVYGDPIESYSVDSFTMYEGKNGKPIERQDVGSSVGFSNIEQVKHYLKTLDREASREKGKELPIKEPKKATKIEEIEVYRADKGQLNLGLGQQSGYYPGLHFFSDKSMTEGFGDKTTSIKIKESDFLDVSGDKVDALEKQVGKTYAAARVPKGSGKWLMDYAKKEGYKGIKRGNEYILHNDLIDTFPNFTKDSKTPGLSIDKKPQEQAKTDKIAPTAIPLDFTKSSKTTEVSSKPAPIKSKDITDEQIGYKKKPLSDKALNQISDKDAFIERLTKQNDRYIKKYGMDKFLEEAEQAYIKQVKRYISKGFEVPKEIIESNPEFQKGLDARARYEKGLYTSFSNKDVRIDYSTKDKIGGGVKRQDGKEITPEQRKEIVDGVTDFSEQLGIDIKRLAEEKNIVFAHLNGKNAFLKQATGLYREQGDKVSISVGGKETAQETIEGKQYYSQVETTMAHELGHALDYIQKNNLLVGLSWEARGKYNPVERLHKYYKKNVEVTARLIEQYYSIKKGNEAYYDKPGYWSKEIFDEYIPRIEKAINEKFSDYMNNKKVPLEKKSRFGEAKENKPVVTEDIYGNKIEEIFIRELNATEKKDPSSLKNMNKLGRKKGYEVVYKPSGTSGRGYYFVKDIEAKTGLEKSIENTKSQQKMKKNIEEAELGKPVPLKKAPKVLEGLENDITYEEARLAHYNTSFSPDKRADSEIRNHIESLESDYEELRKYATTPEKQALLDTEFARYRQGLTKRRKDVLSKRSRVLSAMITGPARFPTASNRKKSGYYENALNDLVEYQEKVKNAIRRKLTDSEMIKSTDADAIQKLEKKVNDLTQMQEQMKGLNRIYKKGNAAMREKMEDYGWKEATIEAVLNEWGEGSKPFAGYQLTNNNNKIKQAKKRLESLKFIEEKSKETGGQSDIKLGEGLQVEGLKAVNNYEAKRLQILFDEIPSKEVREILKSHGFKRSPKNKAWQRHLNNNASYKLKQALKKINDLSNKQ